MHSRRLIVWFLLACVCWLAVPVAGAAEESENLPESWRLEPMAGPGGIFSRGAANVALLSDLRFAYFPSDLWRLGLMHSMRSFPWRRDRSLFQVPGLEGEIRPLSWLGCGLGVGPALIYLRSGEAREFAMGLGWTAHVSAEWRPRPMVGFGAKVLLQQMLVRRSLYSGVGMVAGPVIAW